MNEYLQAIDMLHTLAHSELNPKQPGGLEAQQEQMYGLANQLFQQLAHNTGDSTLNGLMYLLKKAREDDYEP